MGGYIDDGSTDRAGSFLEGAAQDGCICAVLYVLLGVVAPTVQATIEQYDSACRGATLLGSLTLFAGRRCFVVTREGGEIVGVITPYEVRAVYRAGGRKFALQTSCVH
jgi:hypothetical protein